MDGLFDSARALREDYARVDWAATALGPVAGWGPELRAAVELTLSTRFAVTLFWGPEYVLVYNEAYRAMIGDKHPAALGAPARAVFPEIWDSIGPMLEEVSRGDAVWTQNERLLIERSGFAEETFFTFSYSPVRDGAGAVLGAIDIATETTEQVRSLRRLATVSQLSEALNRLIEPSDLARLTLPVLRTAGEDLLAVDIVTDGDPVGDDRLAAGRPDDDTAPAITLQPTSEGTVAWLPLAAPTLSDARYLVALLSPRLQADDGYLGFLRLIASSLVMALERSVARALERRQGEVSREMSETFQRSVLTSPTVPAGYELTVHYRAAAVDAQVGGDWYDAFPLPDGTVTVVVGDVTGHDQHAAAAMAQVRNLLRGVSYTVQQGPAGVLTVLDEAMHGLQAQSLATAVVAQVLPDGELLWSNAGHPPPVHVAADGAARLLATRPEILLGVRTGATRTDHDLRLDVGDTLVLYTDGLVERRGETLDVSTDGLVRVLAGTQQLDTEAICSRLLERYGADADDDIVLLVLRRTGRLG
ncbi:SpoIIE family protein phosphatase [Jatrophihabitans endophyticus]|uniref:SpoIIE family protein phosphatase n=1 Tax=Jatrophihabitans endophyticus TaxID=1206085 RepID=UPI001A03466E|nr:SpoIIE family protein phosphatase [Jatrophihabitans endophyticus]MBE7186659.1 SpoIIE family protein phosphatase [Jatrophihabitans endophyticus]